MSTGIVHRLKNNLRDMPIRQKLGLSYLILIILPVLLIGLFSFYRSSSLIREKTRQYTKDILMETGNNIEVKLREVERLSFQIITNPEIQKALKQANRNFEYEYDRVSWERTVDLLLRGYISSDTDIAAIQIIALKDTTYYINPASVPFSFYSGSEDMKRLEERNGSVVWFDTDPGNQTIAIGRLINDLESQEKAGYLFMYLRESSIFNLYKNTELFKNGDFFVVNRRGNIVSFKEKNRLGSNIGITVEGKELSEIPLFIAFTRLDITNTYLSLILPYIAFALPTSILVLTGFMGSFPREIEEAAVMDGCHMGGIFLRILLPLMKSAIATIAIFSFVSIWNELMFALVFMSDAEKMTLPVSLTRFTGQYSTNWTVQLAATVIMVVPSILVYMFLNDRIIEGITAGAVKG